MKNKQQFNKLTNRAGETFEVKQNIYNEVMAKLRKLKLWNDALVGGANGNVFYIETKNKKLIPFYK